MIAQAGESSRADGPGTSDAHADLHESTTIVLEQIQILVKDVNATAEEIHAAKYLAEKIMNYRVLLRKRPVDEAYEFLTPPNGSAGWYYKAAPGITQSLNWVGPFASRKQAVEAKLKRPGTARNRLDLLNQRLFSGAASNV